MSNKPKNKPPTPRFSPPERRRFRRRILGWYDREKRELPWRGEKDPYRIWVSEAMLQQTRADTVRRRYPAFIERFPTLAALADAPLDAILAEWQGLGYYGRARNLHRAARQVVDQGGSAPPETHDALLALPGVGPYMAGAIASIAFGERCAAIDANALRIMSRILNLSVPIDSPPARKTIRAEALALVPRARPGDFNQALMDLGSRICLPKKPDCAGCPVREMCAGHEAGTQNTLPVKAGKKPPAPVTIFQFRAERNGLVALMQREKTGLFGGMWELPGFMEQGHRENADPHRLRAQCAKLLGRAGVRDANSPEPPERSPTEKFCSWCIWRKARRGNHCKQTRTACCGRRRRKSKPWPSPAPSGPRGARPKARSAQRKKTRTGDDAPFAPSLQPYLPN